MTKTKAALSELLKTYFNRKEILPPDQWSEAEIRLSSRQSTHTGRYSLGRTPFFRRLYRDAVDRDIRQITLVKSAQIGASTFANNLILYHVCNKTLPILMTFPSAELAKNFAERNFHPALESTKAIQEFLTPDINDVRRSEVIFKGCTVRFSGGGSATKLSSAPIAIAIIDEGDKYEAFTSEADVYELVFDRTLSFHESGEAKIILLSTPTLEHSSLVWRHFLEGSQSYYYCPCPHCGHFQRLEFERVKFDHCKRGDGSWDLNAVLNSSYYQCSSCEGPIEEKHRPEMLNKGEWRDTNLDCPKDIRSYHISALYSLNLSFGAIARLFLSSKGDRSRLQNFYNSILGLPWTPQAATVSETAIDKIIERSPEYQKGEIPGRAKALILSADTQQAELYFMITALLEENAVAVVDYGVVISFEDLARILNSQYKIKRTDEMLGIYGGIIDAAGNRTSSVYDFCLSTANRVVPSFGRTEKHRLFAPLRYSSINYKGFSLPLLNVNDKTFTDLLLLNVLRSGSETLFLPKNTEQILKEQLTAVSLVEKKDSKGFSTYDYQSRRDNHLFDCLKLAYSLRYCLLPQLNQPAEPGPPTEQQTSQELDYSDANPWN